MCCYVGVEDVKRLLISGNICKFAFKFISHLPLRCWLVKEYGDECCGNATQCVSHERLF